MTEKAQNPPLLPREDDFTVKKLRLDQIRYDGGTQMRTARSPEMVDSYADKYRSGVQMPKPVVFYDAENYWLADGFQRCEAANTAGLATLEFCVYSGGQRQAVLYACGANESHGLPRDKYAKRRAALTCMLDGEWNQSNRWIAAVCRVSHRFVDLLRNLLEDAKRVEAAGGRPAIEWAKEYCRNPNAKPGEAVWVPPWKATAPKPAAQPSPQEPPIDVPESFRPDPEHSPPPGCGTIRVNDAGLDTYPVGSDDDGESHDSQAEPETEYRVGRDGVKRPARPKPKRKPRPDEPCEAAFDCYGSTDAPEESEAGGESQSPGTTAIGEPLNGLTAPAFSQLPEFAELHRVLTDVMKRVDLLYDSGAGCYFPYQQLRIYLQNCRGWIYEHRPHALCPECGGEGCHRCRESGFIPAVQYKDQQKRARRDDRAA